MKTALLCLSLLLAAPAFAAPVASCPAVMEQLPELLASAKQRVGNDAEARVEFEVNAQGRAQLVAMDGPRAYRSPVRIALQSLDCQAGTPQRYVLNIRFADALPATAMAAAASATVAQATPR